MASSTNIYCDRREKYLVLHMIHLISRNNTKSYNA